MKPNGIQSRVLAFLKATDPNAAPLTAGDIARALSILPMQVSNALNVLHRKNKVNVTYGGRFSTWSTWPKQVEVDVLISAKWIPERGTHEND
jgi:hypothetical protein